MVNNKLILVVLFASYVIDSSAQLLGSIKIQPDDMIELPNVKDSAVSSIIEKTVRPGLFVVKRSFQLQNPKSKELFGLNGRSVFETDYSLGYKTPHGYCVTNKAISPWIYSNAFKKYEGKYLPVISDSKYAELTKDTVCWKDLCLDNQPVIKCDSAIYHFDSELFNGQSFKIDSIIEAKKGWLIWVVWNKKAEIGNVLSLYFSSQEKEIQVEGVNYNVNVEEVPSDVYVLGGIYVIPVFNGIGRIEFHLCGVLSKINDQWEICFPFITNGGDCMGFDTKEMGDAPEEKEELTPIQEKKPKTKKRKKV